MKVEEWKKDNKLSIKDLMFKEKPAKISRSIYWSIYC